MAGALAFDSAAVEASAFSHRIVNTIRLTLLWALLVVALLLLMRRLSGAFQQSLSGWALVGVAIAVELATAFIRWPSLGWAVPTTHLNDREAGGRSPPYVPLATPGLTGILLIAILTVPGVPVVATALAWLIVIGSEAATWYRTFHADGSRGEPAVAEEELPHEDVPAGLIQQVTRVQQEEGESIHALLAARFAPGDSLTVVHLAFCPPLAGTPQLSAHAIDADDLDVRITQAESFGVRIEVRRPQAASAERTATVELIGTADTATS